MDCFDRIYFDRPGYCGIIMVHRRLQTAAIIERLGKYDRVANAGLNFKIPYLETVAKVVDLRTNQLDLDMEAKTKDNIFVRLVLSVQYFVKKDRVSDAYYKLTNHEDQIKSYVYNEVRAHIPKMNLDDAYEVDRSSRKKQYHFYSAQPWWSVRDNGTNQRFDTCR